MAMPQITITVDDRYCLRDVARDLRAKGFVLANMLENIRVLIGSCPEPALSKLPQVEGVLAIEKSRETKILVD
jgi:hypothetical protein